MRADIQTMISEIDKSLSLLRQRLDWDNVRKKREEFDALTEDPDLWNEPDKAQKLMRERQNFIDQVDAHDAMSTELKENIELIELAEVEADEEILQEVVTALKRLKNRASAKELEALLNGEADGNDTFLEIHAGAGGTESQDWAEMLYRMYSMWAESKGFKFNVIDFQNGDEAGLKDCTVEISGDYAYGLLQAEIGIHRLVRISPFDSNSRRHTSFASVSVSPAVNEDIDIEINQKDLRVDTFRSSGAGGQHVNKTDSAIRITHIPSGIVTQCQTQRSQHKNKEQALKVLKSKLFQLEMEKQLLNKKELEGEKKDIGWGSQIRSYVFHPYNMIKDHRTKHEVGNIKSVMDGNIDDFIYSYLLDKMEKNK